MSTVITVLEGMGRCGRYSETTAEETSPLPAFQLEALNSKDSARLLEVLGLAPNMACYVFTPDDNEPAREHPDQEPGSPPDEPPPQDE